MKTERDTTTRRRRKKHFHTLELDGLNDNDEKRYRKDREQLIIMQYSFYVNVILANRR